MLPLPIRSPRSPKLSIVSAPHSAPIPLPIKQVETETYGERLEIEIDENIFREAKKDVEKNSLNLLNISVQE